MLQIDIIGIDPANGNNLLLEVGGQPNPGRSWVKKNQDVLWRVKENIDIEAIEGIMLKDISGNDNIFKSNPPQPVGGNKKIWKAKVDTNAAAGAVYIYNIAWKKKGETSPRTFDPILSIKPIKVLDYSSLLSPGTIITAALVALSIVLAVLLFQSNKEIRQLNQPVQITAPVQ